MSEINRYSSSAGGALQNAAGYFPEGQAPSTVNDAARTVMADLRRQHQVWSAERTATYLVQAYAVTYDREVTAGELGGIFSFIADTANTGSATLNVNAAGAKPIKKLGEHLESSDIDAKQICVVAYNPSGQHYDLLSRVRERTNIGTSIATTSGTTAQFLAIPSWVRKITFSLVGVSTDSGDNLLIQLGDAGGIETSGYLGAAMSASDAADPGVDAVTTGFGIKTGSAAAIIHGSLVISLVNAATFTWAAQGSFARSDAARLLTTAGSKALSAALDRVRLVTSGGAAFDAGEVNILLE